jgi:uncharacterized protein DUF1353
MSATVSELKYRAQALFPPEIARSVEAAIDAEVTERARESAAVPGPEASSILTAYLGDALYERLGVGVFTGRPTVQWNGMNSFVFLASTPLFTYRTASGRLIEPRKIQTDGGSVPRLLHVFQNFSPWGYGPAYIIHDWLFAAHHQNLPPDNDWNFEDTATALAEAIKTLMAVGFTADDGRVQKLDKAEDTLYLIYQAVRSPIALDMWSSR